MQGEDENLPLQNEDFMVIVQSTIQRNMLQKFGAKGDCIDSTQGTTGYDFYFILTTLMVMMNLGPVSRLHGACPVTKTPHSCQCFSKPSRETAAKLLQIGS